MTIRRRLSLSNNLMIILPMVTTLIMGSILVLFIMNITNINFHDMTNEKVIYETESTAKEAIDTGKYLAADDVKLYKYGDNYVVVLADDVDVPVDFDEMRSFYIPLIFVAFLLTVVFITNRALTRYVFRGIITPIETLVNGVHEIRDGNLTYRIKYEREDEFTAICSDFNEMAQRLSDMVSRQQKDESNRKELIAGISHDLRTPLTSIKAYLEGLEKGVATSPQMQGKYIDTIKNKTSDLEYIINQLFLFAKLDIGDFPFHLEEIDIGWELSQLSDSHEREYYEKGLAVSCVENVENIYVKVDLVQFRNVIHNIIENSVKYANNKSAEVKIACYKNGGDVNIILTDNGSGVSEETLIKMFDVFYRSDTARSDTGNGSGLGLAISKKIIERLGGKIKAANADCGGFAIEITLPISKQGA